jgi:hypothetical protein
LGTTSEYQVDRTWGFDYSYDFRKMLILVIGLVNVERLEGNIDPIKIQQMKTEFGHLKPERNLCSHTHIKSTFTIDSPSVTIGRFKNVYLCLKDIEHCVKKMRL